MMRVGCSKGESSRKNCKDGPPKKPLDSASALPPVVRHGSALPLAWFLIWAMPCCGSPVTMVEQSRNKGAAQKETNRANGQAKPCLTTGGKAEAESSGFLGGTPLHELGHDRLRHQIDRCRVVC